jgi:hypothetical protein
LNMLNLASNMLQNISKKAFSALKELKVWQLLANLTYFLKFKSASKRFWFKWRHWNVWFQIWVFFTPYSITSTYLFLTYILLPSILYLMVNPLPLRTWQRQLMITFYIFILENYHMKFLQMLLFQNSFQLLTNHNTTSNVCFIIKKLFEVKYHFSSSSLSGWKGCLKTQKILLVVAMH